jgi:hypothetical protein
MFRRCKNDISAVVRITYNSPRTIHGAQFTVHNLPCTIHRAQFTAHNSPQHNSLRIIHYEKIKNPLDSTRFMLNDC